MKNSIPGFYAEMSAIRAHGSILGLSSMWCVTHTVYIQHCMLSTRGWICWVVPVKVTVCGGPPELY